MSSVSKSSFYGKRRTGGAVNWGAKLSKKEKEYKAHPVPNPYTPKLTSPSFHWQVFYQQNEAFEFQKSKSQDLHVFSYESETFPEKAGQRLYLVASYEQFWHYYKQLKPSQRHHYELIPEGAVCHLYFDLEFSKKLNPSKSGEKMVDIFMKYVCLQLILNYKVPCSISDVIILDSSTDDKFSQHLIFRLPDAVFLNNQDMGSFVNHILDQLWRMVEAHPKERTTHCEDNGPDCAGKNITAAHHSPNVIVEELTKRGLTTEDLLALTVKDGKDNDTIFCDDGVYTRNRNFRLYLSSKLGKKNPFEIAKNNQYKPKIPDGANKYDEQFFLDTLVSNVRYNETLKILRFETGGCHKKSSQSQSQTRQGDPHTSAELGGYKTSPYPEIDDFITTTINKGGVTGSIRRWTYFSQGQILIYDIVNNRWCENIGRPHKSNNIMIVADINHGIYYQKCHDQDCKAVNFKSKDSRLPAHILPAAFFIDSELTEGDLTDDELIIAANEAEFNESQSNEDLNDISDNDLMSAAELIESSLKK